MGRLRNVHNELRGGLGPDEAVRVHRGAVALRAWRVSTYVATKVESFISFGFKVASLSLGLRFGWRRIDLVLPPENISGSSGAGSGLTDASKVTKRSTTS